MKKLFLSVIGLYLGIISVFSQDTHSDSAYKKRRLTYDEANIITSYYAQDGDHSSVTGGIGSEQLTDISTVINIQMSKYDLKGRKHIFSGELGIDHYTSASSDKVDPYSISSASHADTRIYPSVNWRMENEKKGNTIGGGLSYSQEFDYTSLGGNINFTKKTKNKTGEFAAKAQVYLDHLKLIYPIELGYALTGQVGNRKNDYGSAGRNSYSVGLSWSQIINKKFQVMFEAELICQEGYLGLPFHRVYFNDGSVHIQSLPATRLKIPLGLRANYFIGDKFIFRSWYRFYNDDWGITSHAVQLETVAKITPFVSITPFYRFYYQSAADYFKGYEQHTGPAGGETYYTSNYDLAEFNSNFYGAGFRVAPPKGVFNVNRIASMEIRYGHYQKSVGLNSNIISLHLKFR